MVNHISFYRAKSLVTTGKPFSTNALNDDYGEIPQLTNRFFGLVIPVVLNFSSHKSHSKTIFNMHIPDVFSF